MIASLKTRVRAVTAALATFALAACLLAPGRFASELDIRKDGRFTFTYAGDIHLLPLTPAAGSLEPKPFKPRACSDDAGRDRPCASGEIADQKAEWELNRESERRQVQSMKLAMGGVELTSPTAGEQLAQRLRGQTGWKRVDYKGQGRFDVEFSLTGRLDHDFAFPTIEQMPMTNAFVQIAVRKDGSVRIDAPGFDAGASNGAMRGVAAGMIGGLDGGRDQGFPPLDGVFVVRTDGAVLANNTDAGPRADPAGHRLDWRITAATPNAPMALVRLAR